MTTVSTRFRAAPAYATRHAGSPAAILSRLRLRVVVAIDVARGGDEDFADGVRCAAIAGMPALRRIGDEWPMRAASRAYLMRASNGEVG